ncbi:MAG: DsrE family protein [Desulfuromonadaceae bacterium]|nr:DsrE family protein [Desulfuromonadaceae bacterium]
MATKFCRLVCSLTVIAVSLAILVLSAIPAAAVEYAALTGVKGLDSVFDFSLGSPETAAVIFPAVLDVHQNREVRTLPAAPRTVIVFHDSAVKLISTDRKGMEKNDMEAYDKVAEFIRQLKKAGIKMEVCMYAVKVFGVDPVTLMPEIDRVGNGFISVLGYQAQGYSLQVIP